MGNPMHNFKLLFFGGLSWLCYDFLKLPDPLAFQSLDDLHRNCNALPPLKVVS